MRDVVADVLDTRQLADESVPIDALPAECLPVRCCRRDRGRVVGFCPNQLEVLTEHQVGDFPGLLLLRLYRTDRLFAEACAEAFPKVRLYLADHEERQGGVVEPLCDVGQGDDAGHAPVIASDQEIPVIIEPRKVQKEVDVQVDRFREAAWLRFRSAPVRPGASGCPLPRCGSPCWYSSECFEIGGITTGFGLHADGWQPIGNRSTERVVN